MSPLFIHDAALAEWLTAFARMMETTRFERGLFLCRNRRVWDYHASETRIHATVEDGQSVFYEAEIIWKGSAKAALPIKDSQRDLMHYSCTCGFGPEPCAHVAALLIYRIIDLDKKHQTRRSSGSPVLPDFDDTAYRRMFSEFRSSVQKKSPAVENFHPDKLRVRPDFDDMMHLITGQVMKNYRHDEPR